MAPAVLGPDSSSPQPSPASLPRLARTRSPRSRLQPPPGLASQTLVEKALQYSYRACRNKKREMRSLWIQRINAETRQHGVRMVTGDNIQTAKSIAQECGILSPNADTTEPYVIEGKRFRELSEKDREEIAKDISVMGRSSPTDKLLLIQTLCKQGEVVAVTGDGTNDAPALHEADIGLSMGIQGTEVAKESSDIIIIDNNFASVVKVVRWGRSVYANIQKFIQFQLTVNVTALTINVVAAVSSGDVPLNTVQNVTQVNPVASAAQSSRHSSDPHKEAIFLLDPLSHRNRDSSWKEVVNKAITMFNAKIGRRGKKQPHWEIIKAPIQPDSVQCGFFIMRYMKEIIEELANNGSISLRSVFDHRKYSQDEIDEVRVEWANCVLHHV